MPVFQEHPGLLLRFRAGEREALERVYRRYVDDVIRMLKAGFISRSPTAVTHVPGAADESALLDMTQEVFVRAFSPPGRNGYDGVRPYRPYLLQIARNLRIDMLRRAGRELPATAADATNAIDLDAVLGSEAAIEAPAESVDPRWLRLRDATREHLAALCSEQQQFVELRFVQELPQLEVAERMSITRRRVRTLEATVLRSLRKALRQRGLTQSEGDR